MAGSTTPSAPTPEDGGDDERNPKRRKRWPREGVMAAWVGAVGVVLAAIVTAVLTVPELTDSAENPPTPQASASPSSKAAGPGTEKGGLPADPDPGPNDPPANPDPTTGPNDPPANPDPTTVQVGTVWAAESFLARLSGQGTRATRGECQTGGGPILGDSIILTPPIDGGWARWDMIVPVGSGYSELTFRAGVRDAPAPLYNPSAKVTVFVQVGATGPDNSTNKPFDEKRTYGQAHTSVTVRVVEGQRIRIQASAGAGAVDSICFQRPVLRR